MPRYLSSALLLVALATGPCAVSTEERARDMLTAALKEKNPDVRRQAVLALSLAGLRDPFLGLLESMLDDKDVDVRLAAIASLVDLKNKPTAAALHKALEDPAPEVGFSAARALWGMNDPAGREALLAVLSGEMRTSSGFLTKQKRDAMRMMHTPRTIFLFALRQGIGFAPVPGLGEGLASMQGILSDPGISGRASAALLLGREKSPQTRAALREALTDKDASVRAAAVHSLALRNDPALEADLVPLLEDKKDAVRLRAAAGCLRLELLKRRARPAAKTQSGKQAR